MAVFGAMHATLMIPALLVEISDDMQISVAVAGQLATATFAAWGLSVFSVGPLSDSFGRRPIALVGLLVVTGSLIGSAFAPNFETLLVLRVLLGSAGGTCPHLRWRNFRCHFPGKAGPGGRRTAGCWNAGIGGQCAGCGRAD